MKKVCSVLGGACAALIVSSLANAADLPKELLVKTPVRAIYDWTGFYVGGHFGYGTGAFGPNTNPILNQAVMFPSSITGLIGGYQAGYNVQLSERVVLGMEADISLMSPVDAPKLVPGPFDTTIDYVGTLRGRIGYTFGALMPYATGGLAWGQTKLSGFADDGSALFSKQRTHLGWTAGAGIEMAVGGNWSAKLEYDYINLAGRSYDLGDASLPNVHVDPSVHLVKAGLNYRLWNTPSWSSSTPSVKTEVMPEPTDSNVHGQTTFIGQGYSRIRSPYQGANSLPAGGQARETSTADAFLGWRLWDGGEFYFNPELAQGFGLNGTLGLAGFPNGEAQKGGAEYPKFRAQRYFLRQTFGLGGEQEEVADAALQLAGKRDINRVTLTIGRFAVGDFFDGNSYAKDPRADFMNWAIWSAGAYDFPADLPGFTRGAVVELNQKDWALRAGVFQVPEEQNSDVLVFKGGAGAVAELEERYAMFGQPGKLRLGAFANRGKTGNYRNVLGIVASDPSLDINGVMAGSRAERVKYGFYVNMEQAITNNVGIFARASWNDGQTEILSFTDIDRSMSGGVSIKGTAWGRPSDTIGIGGAINGLSGANRDFLAAGGNGLLIGDGQLNYRSEKILEAYYAYNLNAWSTLTLDYQFVANPAYNRDRGPASIFAARAHAEF
jgi:high affinity Mn2+ porin